MLTILQAKQQMEERLERFIDINRPLSGSISRDLTLTMSSMSLEQSLPPPSPMLLGASGRSLSRTSNYGATMTTMAAEGGGDAMVAACLSDGATRFLHHQVVELAGDCLCRSHEDRLCSQYFCDMSQKLDDTIIEVSGYHRATI
jgi:microtubule-associated serine/threonine kinase